MKQLSNITQQLVEYGGGLALLSALYLASLHSYLLFHSLLELIGVVIASAAFLLVWNNRRFIESTFYVIMGIGFLFIAILGLLHTLTCKELKILPAESGNISMQFWIIGRYFESFTLFLALTLQRHRVIAGYVLFAYTLALFSILVVIFRYNIFPACYHVETGLTLFYRISEFVIIVLLSSVLFFMYRIQYLFDRYLFRWLAIAILFSIVAEVLFSLQQELDGIFNLLGHYCKLIYFYLIYKSIIEISLVRPFNSLFYEKEREIEQHGKTEQALRKNEAKLNAILDNLPVMVSSTDTSGHIVLWNLECERVTGYSASEIVNNPEAWNKLCPQEAEQTFCYNPKSYKINHTQMYSQREWALLCKNGVKKTIAWFITYVDIPELTSLAIGQDVTERKKVEHALRMSQMRLAEAQQIAHLGNWEWDFITGEQQCSDEMFRIFGLSPEQDNFTLETFENSLYPDDSEFVLAEIGRAIYQGEPYNLECRIIRPSDKVTRHIQALGQITRTPEGHLHRLIGTVQDITERKHIEEALQESETLLNAIFNVAKVGLCVTDQEGKFVRVNQAYSELYGYHVRELLGRHFTLVLPVADRERANRLYHDFLAGKIEELPSDWLVQNKIGQLLNVYVTAGRLIRRDQQCFKVTSVVDVTARNQMEKALRQSEERFELAMLGANDGLWDWNLETNEFYLSPRFKQQLGFQEDTPLTLEEALELLHPDDVVPFIINMSAYLEKRTSIYENIQRMCHQQGHYIWILSRALVVWDERGKSLRMVGTHVDITERRRAELKLQQAKEAAEVANRAKSVFLANMSHELRTPLNSILGYAQILKQDASLTTEQIRRIDIVYRSGEYLLTLINDVLDLAKIEAGHIEICPTAFLFNEFLKSITELFEVRAKQKGIIFIYQPLSFLPSKIFADERRLRQILINLLGNAIKFTQHGKVTLKVGYHESKMRFQIEDTGIGIANVDLERIFLPFQQAGDTNYHIEGTGLGLSITKKLVEVMEGELYVESIIHKGSKFWFTIKLPEVTVLTLPGQAEKPTIIGYKRSRYSDLLIPPIKILVIDDKEENRSVLVNLLLPLGFKVSEARNGQEGLAIARKLRPSLIFLDLVMPIMDGFETVSQIRKNPLFDKTVVIAVSASVFDYYQHKSLRAGCNDFIAKPVHLEELLNCLKKQLNIEWIYQDTSIQPLIEADSPSLYEEISFTGPTPEQAMTLYELTRRGDINGITAFAQGLAHTDEKLIPFANKIIELAENLQKKKILDLIKSFIDI